MDNKDTGLLLNKQDIELQRFYFNEMVTLLGIYTIYKAPKEATKNYNINGNLEAEYEVGIKVGCIFEEHPTPKTMRRLGWNTELSESSSVIHVPFDLKGLQVGGQFIIPSPLDNSVGRLFRVISISTIMVYPASYSCEIAPVFETNTEQSQLHDYTKTDFNLLNTDRDE